MPAARKKASAPFGGSDNAPLTTIEPLRGAHEEAKRSPSQRGPTIRLFWRTFSLLGGLLLSATLGTLMVLDAFEFEPNIHEGAHQVSSLVSLTRAALLYSDPIARITIIKEIDAQEQVRILLREPGDTYELFDKTALERRFNRKLLEHLSEGSIVARNVNGKDGLWVSFDIEGDTYWLLMDISRAGFALRARTWFIWLLLLAAFTIAGAVLFTRRINLPLQRLSATFARVREGDYSVKLNEQARVVEVRDVNRSFNRMVEQLSRVEQDRAQMLAGISHDLRTPLARLRLETEMSVPDDEARQHMSDDIEQVDAIINKFLDYARPGAALLQSLQLAQLVQTCIAPFLAQGDMRLRVNVPPELYVLCDEVDFSRVLSNLLENARRYGKTPGENVSHVRIAATAEGEWVTLRVQDHGAGVPEELLSQLTRPFFRADSARTAAKGTGLGLSIVARTVEGMDGRMHVANAPSGGLMVIVQLHQATTPLPTTVPQTLR